MANIIEAFVAFDTSSCVMRLRLRRPVGLVRFAFWARSRTPRRRIAKLVRKLAAKCGRLTFCYEAGPTGYGLYLEMDWKGKVLWEVRHPEHTHDGIRLKNANVLLICKKPLPEGYCLQGQRRSSRH